LVEHFLGKEEVRQFKSAQQLQKQNEGIFIGQMTANVCVGIRRLGGNNNGKTKV
jgi:hypothetical protein